MAHVIGDECVSCGACEAECPVGAISQGADHYEINADSCVDCGACAAQCRSYLSGLIVIHMNVTKSIVSGFSGSSALFM